MKYLYYLLYSICVFLSRTVATMVCLPIYYTYWLINITSVIIWNFRMPTKFELQRLDNWRWYVEHSCPGFYCTATDVYLTRGIFYYIWKEPLFIGYTMWQYDKEENERPGLRSSEYCYYRVWTKAARFQSGKVFYTEKALKQRDFNKIIPYDLYYPVKVIKKGKLSHLVVANKNG